jgi:hypothetical protein
MVKSYFQQVLNLKHYFSLVERKFNFSNKGDYARGQLLNDASRLEDLISLTMTDDTKRACETS